MLSGHSTTLSTPHLHSGNAGNCYAVPATDPGIVLWGHSTQGDLKNDQNMEEKPMPPSEISLCPRQMTNSIELNILAIVRQNPGSATVQALIRLLLNLFSCVDDMGLRMFPCPSVPILQSLHMNYGG